MTYADRERIFAKEMLTIKDFEEMFDISYSTAAEQIRNIKIKVEMACHQLRFNIEGRIHSEDYLDYLRIVGDITNERYRKEQDNDRNGKGAYLRNDM